MGGDYSQLCGHFPAVTMDRVPSRGAVVFSIPSHQPWAQSGGCRRQLAPSLLSAFNDLQLWKGVKRIFSVNASETYPFIFPYRLKLFINILFEFFWILFFQTDCDVTDCKVIWIFSLNFAQFLLNFHLLRCLVRGGRYGLVTKQSGHSGHWTHDIKLGPGAGAEYSHLGCVQLCSSAQRGHRGDTVMRAAGGLRP